MSSSAIQNPESFWEEARFQIVCAACGKSRPFHAHHVVDRQTLRRYGVTGNAAYDTRNALRLCAGPLRCHMQFENRRLKVPTLRLLAENIEYAFEILGPWAGDYLRSEYDDSACDQRIIEHVRLQG